MIPALFLVIIAVSAAGGILVKALPPFMLLAKFTYPNAKFNAIGNPFIKNEEIQNMITRDLEDFKTTVNMTRDYAITGETIQDIQRELDQTLKQMVFMAIQDSPAAVKSFYSAFLFKLDLPMLKRGIYAVLEGDDSLKKSEGERTVWTHLPETQELLRRLRDSDRANLPMLLKEYGYPEDLISLLSTQTEEIHFRQIEIALDKVMLSRFENLRLPKQCQKALKRFVLIYRDILNIKTLLRAKEYGLPQNLTRELLVGRGQELEEWKLEELLEMDNVPEVIGHLEGTAYMPFLAAAIVDYEKEKSASPLENALDKCFLHLLADLSMEQPLNLGAGIRFVVSKEYEIRNLKVIAKGLSENFSPETIRRLLVIE